MFRLRFDFPQMDWAAKIRESWDFSEEGARLEAFLGDAEPLMSTAVSPPVEETFEGGAGGSAVSRVSIPSLWSAQPTLVLVGCQRGPRCRPSTFQRKLAWRDLAYWKLTLFPHLPWESLRPPDKVEIDGRLFSG